MTVEDRLTQVLKAEASHIDPDTQWSDVERNLAGRRRSRRLRQAAVSTVAAAAMVAGVLAVVASDDRESGLRVVPPATEPTLGATSTLAPTPMATSTTVGREQGMPERIVAWRENTLVLLETDNGHVIRELARGSRAMATGRTRFGPDGRAYFFDGTGISAVELTGEPPERVAVGEAFAFSPNGRMMAYESIPDGALVLRTLATGSETRIEQSNQEQTIFDVAFVDEQTLLLETSMPEGPGELYRLDVDRARSIGEAERLGPPDGMPAGSGWYSPRPRASDGLIGFVESCCVLDANSYEGGSSSLGVLDPRSGAVKGRVQFAFNIAEIEYDPTGRHMLIIGRTDNGERSTLYRRTGGGAPVLVAENIWSADW